MIIFLHTQIPFFIIIFYTQIPFFMVCLSSSSPLLVGESILQYAYEQLFIVRRWTKVLLSHAITVHLHTYLITLET